MWVSVFPGVGYSFDACAKLDSRQSKNPPDSWGHLWALRSDQPCLGPLILHMDPGIPFYLSPWHKLHYRLIPRPRESLFQLYLLMLPSGSLRQTLDWFKPSRSCELSVKPLTSHCLCPPVPDPVGWHPSVRA